MRTVEEQIFNSMIQQGAFAALFVWMLLLRKKNEQREEQYQKVIEKPSSHRRTGKSIWFTFKGCIRY